MTGIHFRDHDSQMCATRHDLFTHDGVLRDRARCKIDDRRRVSDPDRDVRVLLLDSHLGHAFIH